MSGDGETKPNPTPGQLAALNAFRAPRMSTNDLELNIRGTILDAIVDTAAITGLRAGEASDALQEAIYQTLVIRADRRRILMELLLRLGEAEVLELRADLRRALDVSDRALDIADRVLETTRPDEFPELRP